MKKIYYFLIMMCIPSLLVAQSSGEIKGKVLDAKTNEILPGTTVYVEIMGKKYPTVADSRGEFVIKPLDPGIYRVYFTFIGYDSLVLNSVRVYTDKTTFLENTYLSSGILLKGCEKKEYKEKLINPEKPSEIPIINSERKEMADGRTLAGALRGMCPTVFVSDKGDDIYFRGSRNGDAVYYVDGVKTRDSDLHIPGNAIKSMTVYMGGVPANYGDFTGGVVVVETQSYFSWLNERKARSYPTVKYVIHQTQEQ